MKRDQSLKLNKDFIKVYSRGKKAVGAYTAVYALKTYLPAGRLGITVNKHTANACGRNRIKRLIRESVSAKWDRLAPGYDIVVVARARAAGKSLGQISADIGYCFGTLSLYKEETQK